MNAGAAVATLHGRDGEIVQGNGGTAIVRREVGSDLARREAVAGLIRPVARPEELIKAQEEVREIIAKTLKKGRDYDRIPGTKKDTMLQPGAERSAAAYGLAPEFELVEQEVDHDRRVEWTKEKWVSAGKKPENWEALKARGLGRNRQVNGHWEWQEKLDDTGVSLGLYRYVLRCRLVHRESGVVVGEGVGSCSTMESKYIDRPRDLENTALKMAKKRAYVDAVLTTLGLHDQFTQDVEDLPREMFQGDGDSDGSGVTGSSEPGEALPTCPQCDGAMWDNRSDNDEREKNGEKLRPDWKCRDKGCKGVYWRGDWPPPEDESSGQIAAELDRLAAGIRMMINGVKAIDPQRGEDAEKFAESVLQQENVTEADLRKCGNTVLRTLRQMQEEQEKAKKKTPPNVSRNAQGEPELFERRPPKEQGAGYDNYETPPFPDDDDLPF